MNRSLFTVTALIATAASAIGQSGPTSQSSMESTVVSETIAAPPTEVWKAFATEEGFKRLGVAHCELDLRIGGKIRTHYDPKGVIGDDGTIVNEVLSFEPNRMLSIRIHQPPKTFPFPPEVWKPTWSVITLSDLGDGRTQVRLAGMGYTGSEQSRAMRDFFEKGNSWVLKKLKASHEGVEGPKPATAHASDPLSPLVIERVIDRPASDAWLRMASSAGWKESFGVESTIEMRPGGKFEVYFSMEPPAGRRGSEGCTVLSYVPNRMVSFTWNAPPNLPAARSNHSWVVVEFEAIEADRTRVRLTQQGFAELAAADPGHREEYERARAYFLNAWPKVLDAMQPAQAAAK